jgi:hypothetical protein
VFSFFFPRPKGWKKAEELFNIKKYVKIVHPLGSG